MTNFGMPGSELIAHQIADAMSKMVDRQIERNAWLKRNEQQEREGQLNKRLPSDRNV